MCREPEARREPAGAIGVSPDNVERAIENGAFLVGLLSCRPILESKQHGHEMARLTVDQDMKLGSALDQLEDAIEAAYTSLKMVRWAQLNVARYAGGILGPELNAKIRAVPLDVERLWELARIPTKAEQEDRRELVDFVEDHNQKILNVIVAHED